MVNLFVFIPGLHGTVLGSIGTLKDDNSIKEQFKSGRVLVLW